MFLASLLFGFFGAACVFKLASDLLVAAVGESLNRFSDLGPHGTRWIWPRDRGKLVAYSVAAMVVGAACFGLSYILAMRAFAAGS